MDLRNFYLVEYREGLGWHKTSATPDLESIHFAVARLLNHHYGPIRIRAVYGDYDNPFKSKLKKWKDD